MKIIESLKNRRSYYNIDRNTDVSEDRILDAIKEITELVPDAYNLQSQNLVVALGEKQDELWDTIYDAFDGKVSREKIDSFKAGLGTILFFIDEKKVKGLQEQFPRYAENFPVWTNHSNGMLQISLWTGLRELGLGASLQHYNPVIDEQVKKLFNVPEHFKLIAQMPFGNIVEEPEAKEKENIDERVKVFK